MAYTDASLHRVAETGNGKSVWFYHTIDVHASVDTATYFTGEALNKLKVGDLLVTAVYTTAVTGAIATMGFHVVKDVSATAVDLTDVTVLTMTDTD